MTDKFLPEALPPQEHSLSKVFFGHFVSAVLEQERTTVSSFHAYHRGELEHCPFAIHWKHSHVVLVTPTFRLFESWSILLFRLFHFWLWNFVSWSFDLCLLTMVFVNFRYFDLERHWQSTMLRCISHVAVLSVITRVVCTTSNKPSVRHTVECILWQLVQACLRTRECQVYQFWPNTGISRQLVGILWTSLKLLSS